MTVNGNGDDSAASEIHRLENEIQQITGPEARANALAGELRAEREAREKALDDLRARRRRRLFRVIRGGGMIAAILALVRAARDHAVITALSAGLLVGAGGTGVVMGGVVPHYHQAGPAGPGPGALHPLRPGRTPSPGRPAIPPSEAPSPTPAPAGPGSPTPTPLPTGSAEPTVTATATPTEIAPTGTSSPQPTPTETTPAPTTPPPTTTPPKPAKTCPIEVKLLVLDLTLLCHK